MAPSGRIVIIAATRHHHRQASSWSLARGWPGARRSRDNNQTGAELAWPLGVANCKSNLRRALERGRQLLGQSFK